MTTAPPVELMTLAVIISDPSAATGRLLARQLEDEAEDIEVLAVVRSPGEVERAVRELLPDVVVLSLSGDDDASPIVRRMRSASPSVRVLLLASSTSGGRVYPAIKAGASAAVVRWALACSHVAAIRDAAADRTLLPQGLANIIRRDLADFQPGLVTPDEDRILAAIGLGDGVARIALALRLPEQLVWRRLRDIRAKLEVADRVMSARGNTAPPRGFGASTVSLTAEERAATRGVRAGGAGESGQQGAGDRAG